MNYAARIQNSQSEDKCYGKRDDNLHVLWKYAVKVD